MIGFVLGLLGTAWLLHRVAELPDLPAAVAPLALAVAGGCWLAARYAGRLAVPAAVLTGGALAVNLVAWHATGWLGQVVTPELEGAEVTVTVRVASLPEHDARRSRFRAIVEEIHNAPSGFAAGELQVSTYPARPALRAGERRKMTLRLRPPAGHANPGGFDRAAWYYREGLHGGASLRWLGSAAGEHPGTAWRARARGHLHAARGWLRDRLEQAAPELRHPGLVHALVIGDRQGMSEAEWQAFLRTGTNHLMAISGLHVGLVAGFAGLLGARLWAWFPPVRHTVSRPAFMALTGVLGAAVYAGLAGFSIPTQRALIMLTAFMAALLWRRDAVAWRGLGLAAVAVLVLQPASVLAPGFWFSFGAVAVILLLMQGRLGRPGWREAGAVQVVLALAMLPLSLAWFQLGAWVAPLANLVAVPVVSLLALPLLLAGAGLALVWPPLASPLLHLGDGVLGALLTLLEGMAQLPHLVDQRQVPLAASLLGAVAVLLALQPRTRLAAPWIVLAGLALVLPLRPDLETGSYRVDLLDVGSGQAILVRTRGHALLFDSAWGRAGGYSAGEHVVLPALRALGVGELDKLIISHAHAGHAGGAPAIREALPVGQVLRRDPREPDEAECRAGQVWAWDGVRFEVLHPPPGWNAEAPASCVLAIEAVAGRVLLTGGLSGLGEAVLMRESRERLASDVLVVPRGAGRDALSRGWLRQASPAVAWASTTRRGDGVSDALRERLAAACVPLQESGRDGHLWLEAGEELVVGQGRRARHRRFWEAATGTPFLPVECGETRAAANDW